LTLVALSLFLAASASAATRTWDGGCGGETAWSCAANWSENTVPAAGDTATFNGTSSNNSTVDPGFAGTIATVKVNAGYTGTITLARSLTVSTVFTQAAGSFTAAGQSLTLKAFTLSGGSFTASSGTTSVSTALTISGSPTFSANGGTVAFNGASNASLSCNNVTFNLVTFIHTAGTKTVGSNCSLPLGANPSAISGGSIVLNGTLSGTGTLTAGKTLTLGATGSLSGFSGLAAYALVVNGAYDFGSYSPFTVDSTFTVGGGADLTAPEGTGSFSGAFAVSSTATFDANGGTLNFDATAPISLSCGNQAFNLVTFETTARKTIGSDCTLPLGTDPSLGQGGTTLYGTLVGDGTLTQTGTFEIASTSPGLDEFSDVLDVGSFLLTAGAFTAPPGTLTVQGNFTIGGSATFDANEGTVDFQAVPLTTKTIACNEAEFNLVTLTNTSKQVVGSDCTLPLGAGPEIGDGGQIVVNGDLTGSGSLTADSLLLTLGSTGGLSGFSGLSSDALLVEGTYDFGAYETFAVGGDFTIGGAGQFTAPEGTASFAGDFVNSGAFEANEGAVELTGANQTLGGSTIFNDLTKVVEAADTLTFAAGAIQTVEGALALEGASSEELLSLVSSTPETAWILTGEGTRSAKWLSVADSENTGTEITAIESTDAGGNTGWSFP
jgi:hypothetical protein